MLDNSKLSLTVKENLRNLTYEQKVSIWNKNCSECPFATIKVFTAYNLIECKNLTEAEDIVRFDNESYIERGCNFDEGEYTLKEIITNTCKLWTVKRSDNEEGIFEEVEIIEETSIVNVGWEEKKEGHSI